MAVGDVVSSMSAVGAALTFQPALGVELLIGFISGNLGGMNYGLYNGTVMTSGNYSATQLASPSNNRLFINNTIYFQLNASATHSNGFSGIQIK